MAEPGRGGFLGRIVNRLTGLAGIVVVRRASLAGERARARDQIADLRKAGKELSQELAASQKAGRRWLARYERAAAEIKSLEAVTSASAEQAAKELNDTVHRLRAAEAEIGTLTGQLDEERRDASALRQRLAEAADHGAAKGAAANKAILDLRRAFHAVRARLLTVAKGSDAGGGAGTLVPAARTAIERAAALGFAIVGAPGSAVAKELGVAAYGGNVAALGGRGVVAVSDGLGRAFGTDLAVSAEPPIQVLALAELLGRLAAADPAADPADAFAHIEPDRPLKQLVLLVSADEAIRHGLGELLGGKTVPFPPLLLDRENRLEVDADAWLLQATARQNFPKRLPVVLSPAEATALADWTATHSNALMASVLKQSAVIHFAWSDPALATVLAYFDRLEGTEHVFDSGDAKQLIDRYVALANDQTRLARLAAGPSPLSQADWSTLYVDAPDADGLAAAATTLPLPKKGPSLRAALPSPERLGEEAIAAAAALLDLAIDQCLESADAGLYPVSPQVALGEALAALGRHADARKAYRQALADDPLDWPVREQVALYDELAGDVARAEKVLREGTRILGQEKRSYGALVRLHLRHEALDKAEAAIREGEANDAAAPLKSVIASYVALGKFAEAKRYIEPRLRKVSADAPLHDLVDLPEAEQGLAALREAVDGGAEEKRLALAETLRRLGQRSEAIAHYRKALGDRKRKSAGPDLLLVGPARTGTTLLRRLLSMHDRIGFLPGEPGFFAGGHKRLDDYLAAVAAERGGKRGRLVADKSPSYFAMDAEGIALAKLVSPKLRVVVTLREPLARFWSRMNQLDETDRIEIAAGLGADHIPPWLCAEAEPGRYHAHLAKWVEAVGGDNIMLLDLDYLQSDPAAAVNGVLEALGLRQLPEEDLRQVQRVWTNSVGGPGPSDAAAALFDKDYGGEAYRAEALARGLGGSVRIIGSQLR